MRRKYGLSAAPLVERREAEMPQQQVAEPRVLLRKHLLLHAPKAARVALRGRGAEMCAVALRSTARGVDDEVVVLAFRLCGVSLSVKAGAGLLATGLCADRESLGYVGISSFLHRKKIYVNKAVTKIARIISVWNKSGF